MPKQPPPLIYRDGEALYLEFSGHALRFPFTEGGLSKALAHIPSITSAPGYLSGRSNFAAKVLKPKIAKATQRKRDIGKLPEGAKTAAMEIARKMKPIS